MDLQKELHPHKVHFYTYVSLSVNLVVNPLTYWNILIDFTIGPLEILDSYYPAIAGVLLLTGIVLAVRERNIRRVLPGLMINTALLVWGILDIYSLSQLTTVPTL